jgi:hypothetical protein
MPFFCQLLLITINYHQYDGGCDAADAAALSIQRQRRRSPLYLLPLCLPTA